LYCIVILLTLYYNVVVFNRTATHFNFIVIALQLHLIVL